MDDASLLSRMLPIVYTRFLLPYHILIDCLLIIFHTETWKFLHRTFIYFQIKKTILMLTRTIELKDKALVDIESPKCSNLIASTFQILEC